MIARESIPNSINEILVFGSIIQQSATNQSDVDVLIIHSSKIPGDYLVVNNFINTFKKKATKHIKRLVDVFLVHNNSYKFIFETGSAYNLGDSKEKFISIYQKNNAPKFLFKINPNARQTATSSAILLLLDILNSIPDIDYYKRRNNLKKAYWFSQHINFLDPLNNNLCKKIMLRRKKITREDFVSTCINDMDMANMVIKNGRKINLSIISLLTIYTVQFCNYYFIELKRFNSTVSFGQVESNLIKHFFQKGLSLMLRISMAYNIKELLWMRKESSYPYRVAFQKLADTYVVNNHLSGQLKKNLKMDVAILLFLLDFVVLKIKPS